MAKTVGDLLIKLGVDGIEGVNVLKSSLTALGKAAGPTDKNIRKIRTEILEFANAGQKSTQAIRGVIESFKGLQAQASIGSGVFKQLAADIEGLENSLESIKPDAQKAAEAMDKLQRIGFPSRAPDAFEKNMKERRRQLQGLKVDSEEYLTILVGIRNFESQQAARVARAEVSAAARVARTGMPSSIVQADQPATLAALRLRIGEVQNEIENLDFTTKDYADANRELIALQQSLSKALSGTSSSFDNLGDAQARAARRAEKLAGISAATGGAGINPRTGTPMAARDPNTGVMIAGGSAVSAIPTPVPELSSLYKTITQIETAGVDATLDRMGKSYQEVTKDIRSATVASNGSINSLQAQRSAFAQLRAGLDPTSQDFRELSKEIEKADRRLEKLNKRRRGPVGARQATQIAGAVVSGGIFGGPEGAIGALGGAALGGVEGAFAGAAIGAQLKGLRDLAASAANYAADIEKLQIALKGVAGPQADYNSAIQTAQEVTNTFNIPQRDAIRGVTRLAAAVKGANGPIEDAETTFKNITAAIKATGGSTEDVRGAITAMVQVFSKGKVSAEELSGQLGERLPGAVTKFAEANDMTLPELQKNLKAGTVGLNELMNFIRELGDTYGETAEQIADSNAEAGARLTVVIQNMQADIGKALVPIGAQFQAAFAEFITNITPFLIDFVPKIAKGFLTLAKNLDTLLVAATAAFAVFASVKLAKIVSDVDSISKAVEFLTGKLKAAGLANPFTALGIAAAGLAGFIHNAAKEQARFNDLLKKGSVAQIDADLLKQRAALDEALIKQLKAQQEPQAPYGFEFGGIDVAAADAEVALIEDKIAKLEKRRSQIFDIDPTQGAALNSYDFDRFVYKSIVPDESGTANTINTIKDITKAEAAAQIESIRNRTRGIELTKEAIAKEAELARVAAEKLPPNRKSVELAKIAQKEAGQLNKLQQDELRTANDVAKAKLELNEFLIKAKGEQGLLNEEQAQQELNQIKVNELMLKYNILVEKGVYKQEELKEKIEEAVAALNKAESPLQSFKDGLKKVFEEAMNLNQALATAGVQAVQQFGDAFADFVATGKASFADLTRSILQDLSRIFARAAFFKALSFIPGVGNFLGLGSNGGGGGGGASAQSPDPMFNNFLIAGKGAAFARNNIVPYAMGGIVKKPTLFQYANGGSGRFGLMGEAGPEAIMPLRRGRDGKLGVEASGGVGNVVVNVDASGSRVQGDQPNAKALGSAIGAAVQAEIVRQKRPGGLLS